MISAVLFIPDPADLAFHFCQISSSVSSSVSCSAHRVLHLLSRTHKTPIHDLSQDGLVAENEKQVQEQELQEERAADEVCGPREPLRRRPACVDHVVAAEDTAQASTIRGRHHFPVPAVHDVRPFGSESTLDLQQDTRVLDDMVGLSLAPGLSESFRMGYVPIRQCPRR